jgi:hypothetical protein
MWWLNIRGQLSSHSKMKRFFWSSTVKGMMVLLGVVVLSRVSLWAFPIVSMLSFWSSAVFLILLL